LTTRSPTERVISEIAKGTHDGQLMDIADAITDRLRTDTVSLLWRITLDGETWDAETVTLGELRFVETMTSKSYLELNPGASMAELTALIVAHYVARGDDREVAFKKADSLTQQQALEAIELYEGTLGKG
jgi:hypothetical protein